jgi:hypothetical protein
MVKILKFLLLPVMLVLITTTGLISATIPSRQARNLWFSNVTGTTMQVNWTNGFGGGRIVVVQHDESATPSWTNPTNNTPYVPSDPGNFTGSNPTLGPGKVLYNGSGSINSVTLTNLAPSARIWCRVYEFNRGGGSPDPCYLTTTDLANPRDRYTIASLNAPSIDTFRVRFATAELTWPNVSSAAGYKIDVSTSTNFTSFVADYQGLDIGNPTDGSHCLFQIEGLNQNTTYYARIRAYNGTIESSNSNMVTFTTTGNPGAPTFAVQYYANYNDATYFNSGTGHYGQNPLDVTTNTPVLGQTRLSLWGGQTYWVKITASHEMADAPIVALYVSSATPGHWDIDISGQTYATQFSADTVGGNYMPVYLVQRYVPTYSELGSHPEDYYYGFNEQWYFWGSDIVGNNASAVTPTNPNNQGNVTNNTPAIVISNPSTNLTTNGPVTDTVTYYGATSISLVSGNVTLNTTGTATAGSITINGGSANNIKLVSLGSISGDGTIGISLAAATATNSPHFGASPAAGPSTTFNVDNTNPTVSITSPTASGCTNGSLTTLTFTDNDPVTGGYASGINTKQVQINGGGFNAVTSGVLLNTLIGWGSISDGGSVTLDVKATDNAGNSHTTSVTFNKDDTDPTLTLSTPSNGDCVKGTELLTFTPGYTGCTGSIKAKINSGTFYDVTSGTALASLTDWALVDDGDLFSVTVKVTDGAGNTASSTISNLHKDISSPLISITNPDISTTCVDSTFVINITDSDPTNGCGITSIQARINSASFEDFTDGAIFASINGWSGVSDGASFTLDIKATDHVGHTTTATRTLTRNLPTPIVTINYPTASTCINDTATLHFSAASGCATVTNEARIGNSAPWEAVSNGALINTISGWAGVSDGSTFDLNIRSTNMINNNIGYATVNLTMDVTNPTLTFTSTPDICVNASAAFTFTTDGTGCGVASVKAKIGAGSYSTVSSGASFGSVSGWSGVTDGTGFTLSILVIDYAGNTFTGTYNFTKDITNPTASVNSPAVNAWVNGSEGLTFNTNDGTGCGVTTTEAKIGSGTYNTISSGAIINTINGWSTASDGAITVSIKVTDLAGNFSVTTYGLRKDVSNPSATISSPAVDACVKGTATISFTTSDGTGSGVANVKAKIGANTYQAITSGAAINTINGFAGVSDSSLFTVDFQITDNVGNVGTASREFYNDETAPTTGFTTLTAGSYVNTFSTISFWTYDASTCGLTKQVSVDNTNWFTATSGTTAFGDITQFASIPDGNSFTLYLKVTDAAGNVGTANVSLNKDVTPPIVVSINRVGSTPTNAATVDFTVTFSKNVTGVTASNFTVNQTGLTGASVTNVTGSGTTWTVTANTGSNSPDNGTITVNMANSTNVVDRASNSVFNVPYTSGQTYTIDKVNPSVTVSAPLTDACIKNTATINFTTSDGPGTGVSTVKARIGSASYTAITTGALFSSIQGYGAATDNSLFNVDFQITDNAGNVQNTSKEFFKDETAPAVSITSPSSGAYVNASATISFTTNDASTCGLTNQVSLDNTNWFTVTSGITTFGNITQFGTSPDGAITLYIKTTDAAGNVGTSSISLFKDVTPPTVSSIVRVGSTPTNAATVDFTVTFSEAVTGLATSNFGVTVTPTDSITGASVTNVAGSGTTWTVTVNTGSNNPANVQLRLDMTNNTGVVDHANNLVSNTPYTAGQNYVIDKVAPYSSTSTFSESNGEWANGATGVNFTNTGCDSLFLTITFNEAHTVLPGTGNILIKKTSNDSTVMTINAATRVTIAANVAHISLTGNLLGNTEFYVTIPAGAFKDNAGNSYAGISSTSAWTFTTVNRAAVPTITSQTISIPGRTSITLTLNMSYAGGKAMIVGRKGIGGGALDTLGIDNQFDECQLDGQVPLSAGAQAFGNGLNLGHKSGFRGNTDVFVVYVGSASSVTITGLSGSTQYTFAMYPFNTIGNDATTASYNLNALTATRRTARLSDPNAIAGQNDEITVYPIAPNPVINNINFQVDLVNADQLTVEIINTLGEVINVPINNIEYPAGMSDISIPLMNVTAGTYMLRVSTPTDQVIQKFVYIP